MSKDKPRSKSVAVVLILLVGLVALIIRTGNMPRLLEWIYSPQARLTAVIMLVEYVVLKGADRSAIYRRELEAVRAKRAEDLRAFQMLETELTALRGDLTGPQEAEGGAKAGKGKPAAGPSAAAGRRIDSLLEKLRERI